MSFHISQRFIDELLEEDCPYMDLTVEALGIGREPGLLTCHPKAACVVAGVEVAARLLESSGCRVACEAASGDRLEAGQVFLRAEGSAGANLRAGEAVNTFDMMMGNIRGTIGETSVIAIMIGAMFLILMGVIDLRIPGTYIVTFVIFITLFGGHGFDPQYITAHLCGGGLMLGAWFMATDYVTSPITKTGQIVYGVCLGLLTGIFRLFGGSAEGVSYAIIISNLLVPLIEKITLPRPFGKGGER